MDMEKLSLMDKELIEKALSLPYIQWNEILSLMDKTQNEWVKETLKYIMIEKNIREQLSV